MCRAIDWAIHRSNKEKYNNLSINVGSNSNNLTIFNLAKKVSRIIPNTKVVKINNAQKDKRSYKVDFGLFRRMAKGYLPIMTLDRSIKNIYAQVKKINFKDKDFRESSLIRLKYLKKLQKHKKITKSLYWKTCL